MSEIGEKVRSVRKFLGLTQKEFGKTMTVTQAYISRVESGQERPTDMFIKLFCLLYGVDESIIK